MTSSFAADIGSDYRGSPPLEDSTGVATPPEPDEGDQPDQRNDGIAHNAADRVERSMERGHEKVRAQDYPGETKVDAAGGGEESAAAQPRPHPLTPERRHAPHHPAGERPVK